MDEPVQDIIKTFFGASPLSLRDIAQAIRRFGWVFNSLPDKQIEKATMAAVSLILRTLNGTLYQRFAQGEVSDADVAEALFGIPSITPCDGKEKGSCFRQASCLPTRS